MTKSAKRRKDLGPFLVAIGSMLWATDALVRLPTVGALSPAFIVFAEHAVGLSLLLPWAIFSHRKSLFDLKPGEWASAGIVGVGGSAIATLLFTSSFRYVNPSVSILLQKLQPLIVILLARLVLREKPHEGFYRWGLLAFVSAFVLSFPDFDLGLGTLRIQGVASSLGAGLLWAVATVAGKSLLARITPGVATFWRFFFGFIGTGAILLATGPDWSLPHDPKLIWALLYLGTVPGLLAMIAYYAGMKRTPASVVTLIELLFPLSAVLLNWVVLGLPLSATQLVAGAMLVFSVLQVTRTQN